MEILSAKIISDAKFKDEKKMEVKFTEPRKNSKKDAKASKEYPDLVHPDLTKAYKELIPHFAALSGWIAYDQIKDIADISDPLFERYRVTGFHMHGEENESVGLNGYFVRPSDGKAINYVVPPQKDYPFESELQKALTNVINEVTAFINEEKFTSLEEAEQKRLAKINAKGDGESEDAGENQLEMFDRKVTNAQIAEPEVSKITGKIGHADPEAMQRVSEMKNTEAKRRGRKPQSADNKTGE